MSAPAATVVLRRRLRRLLGWLGLPTPAWIAPAAASEDTTPVAWLVAYIYDPEFANGVASVLQLLDEHLPHTGLEVPRAFTAEATPLEQQQCLSYFRLAGAAAQRSLDHEWVPVSTRSDARALVDFKFGALGASLWETASSIRAGFTSLNSLEAFAFFFEPREMNACLSGLRLGTGGKLFTSEASLRPYVNAQHGFDSTSREVQWLVSVLVAMSEEDERHFLEFLTGSPMVPMNGLEGMRRPITVVKKDFPAGVQAEKETTLPSCNTCFFYLKLPPYSSEAVLKERLLMACREGRKNFSHS